MCTTLSPGSDTGRYDHGTSKVSAALPSWTSINNDVNSTSSTMDIDVTSYRGIWGALETPICALPSFDLTAPLLFNNINSSE